jgi:hypothetical protein
MKKEKKNDLSDCTKDYFIKGISLEYENELFDRAIKSLGINKKDLTTEEVLKKVNLEMRRLRQEDELKC